MQKQPTCWAEDSHASAVCTSI